MEIRKYPQTYIYPTMISWESVKDRHIKGASPLGVVWIRLDRDLTPNSWYTEFSGETKKEVARSGDSVDLIKSLIEEEYSRWRLSKHLEDK